MAVTTRRTFLRRIGGAAAAAALAGCGSGGGSGRTRPNILFVWSDDQSAGDVGCYGRADLRTPHLDRLATGGLRFERAFAITPQCSPSRSAVLTGRTPHATGTSRLHAPLPAHEPSVLEPLKQAGYYTGSFRKVHLGAAFRERWDFDGAAADSFEDAPGVTFRDFFEQRPADQPFFLHVGLIDPHRPYADGVLDVPHAPADVTVPPFLPDMPSVRSDLAHYYDEITRLDRDVGTLLDLLDTYGLTETTMVVFTSDNGMPFPGAKGTLYDPGVHVPLIVRWPGVVEAGRTTDALVSLIDLAPTWLAAAGAEALPQAEGQSLLPLLQGTGRPTPRPAVFAERNWHDHLDLVRAVRTERYKLIQNYKPRWPYRPPLDVAGAPAWQAVQDAHAAGRLRPALARRYFAPERPQVELYDLAADPDEETNLAGRAAHADTVATLQQRLSDWMLATNDFLPPPIGAFGGYDVGDVDPL
jgi:arylsulfatase A-like enzyme